MAVTIHEMFVKHKQYVCVNSDIDHVNFLFMDRQKEQDDKKALKIAAFKRLVKILRDKKISNVEFQKMKGIDSQTWNNWRDRGLPDKEILKIPEILNINITELTTGQSAQPKPLQVEANGKWLSGFDLWDGATPIYDDEVALPFFREVELAAGSGRHEVQENHGRKLRFAKSTLKKHGVASETAACITVSGNSMEPVLPHGATIGIDTGNTIIKDGDMYAIDHEGHLRVKLLYKIPGGGLRLRSINHEEWPDEFYTGYTEDKIKVLGRVFWYSVLR
jgi:phage repressor protein C with HTH and peptisase S24 domain